MQILNNEVYKQKNSISLIASENLTSYNVRQALSSVLTNKYAEGYPNRRYYSGCEHADEIENYAIDLAKKIFNAKFANVQPHSGSQANQAVYFALLNLDDTILSLSLNAGGHLTHGYEKNISGKSFNIVHYGLDSNGFIDMNEVESLAKKHKPKLIIAGASAYARLWDWKKFREIANSVGSLLMVDMAHIAGIVAAQECSNPVEYADVVTSTTHKTLRGPRGGIILSNNLEIGKKINSALFPGIQGGPLMNIIAAKAVAFSEIWDVDNDCVQASFKKYIQNVLKNAKILSKKIMDNGGKLVSSGTDNHLFILDCRSFDMNGKEMEFLLKEAQIYLSVSALINDSWDKPNGVRLGTPYITNLLDDITDFAEIFVDSLKTKNTINLKNKVKEILNFDNAFFD